jgi:phenylacetate-CoA ligase
LEFHPSIEKSEIQEIKKFQEEKLHELLAYLETHSPFYQKLFREHDIRIGIFDVGRSSEDSYHHKNDLQQHNHDFFCITPDKIVDYSTTSGTLGDPVTLDCQTVILKDWLTMKPYLLPVQEFRKEMLCR